MSDFNKEIKNLINDPYFHKWLIDSDEDCSSFWNQWIHEQPNRKEIVERAKQILLSMDFKVHTMPDNSVEDLWDNIQYDIDGKKLNSGFTNRFKIVAAVALLVVSGALVFLNVDWMESSSLEQEILLVEKIIPIGQKSTLHLSDGTIIKLNSGSKISYPRQFKDGLREVRLEGEAFFEVAKDKKRPFTVLTGDVTTTVLGTSFNIKAVENTDQIQVAVVTGKVEVKSNIVSSENESEKWVYLEPNSQAIFNRQTQELSKSAYDPMLVLSWKEGVIYFEEADFEEIVEVLEKWYGITFRMDKPIQIDKDFSGQFDNKTLDDVLVGMSFSLDFQYTIKDKVVRIF